MRNSKTVIVTFLSGMLSGALMCLLMVSRNVDNVQESGNTNVRTYNVNTLKNGTLNGDVDDYILLKKSFATSGFPEEILYYSLIMANKYNYVPANYDVYKSLSDFFVKQDLGTIDNETYKFILSYLYYGCQKGDSASCKDLIKLKHDFSSPIQ